MLVCRIRLEGCDPGVLNIVVIAEARVRNLSGETTTDKEGAADNSGICVQVCEGCSLGFSLDLVWKES